ncbi:thioredoxin reductase [Mycoplasmopsis maculosa]|uniref:Thioredoxin reductase n=1 Tax=Mycoplasmopsis maculosa TaxID=114885 RepID=A0A449B3N9_9BACT|nr:dihydrolipoyl dehydrogenase [Mycoplasmopsis maculosa]VEU75158.1 thioredoxin reductase [Mycoplasmopsis maculosa]
MKKFDIVVLGAGPGGYSLANILSSNGKKVALIEKKHFGGTCVNEGCISTKTLIKSAKVFENIKSAKEYGLISEKNDFNFQAIQERRINNKNLLNGAIKNSIIDAGVEILFGEGEVIDKNTLIVNGEKINTDILVLATGARSRELDIKGFKEAKDNGILINSTDAMSLSKKPDSLTIIGSGPVALEFAYFYSTFGTKVTIVEANKFMSNFDIDLQTKVKEYILDRNIEIIENAKIQEINDNALIIKQGDEIKEIVSSYILSAVGRVANTESFKKLNLELNPNGSVKVNQYMETSIQNVYALGDVTGIMMLSTFAYKSGDVIAKRILNKEALKEVVNPKLIPWSVYLNPEFSGVGYTEQELKDKNVDYAVVNVPTAALPRAHADNLDKKTGFIKMLVDKKTDKLLGAFMFVEGSHLIINELALAMSKDITFTQLQEHPFTHPTISEAVYYGSRGYTFSKK